MIWCGPKVYIQTDTPPVLLPFMCLPKTLPNFFRNLGSRPVVKPEEQLLVTARGTGTSLSGTVCWKENANM